jgi:hypothetical protein
MSEARTWVRVARSLNVISVDTTFANPICERNFYALRLLNEKPTNRTACHVPRNLLLEADTAEGMAMEDS